MSRLKIQEDICVRCGRCCYEKIEFEGKIYYTEEPCDKLDLKTKLCTVYENRHIDRPGCTPLSPRVIAKGVLPADCPYVRDIEGYEGPSLHGEEELAEICGGGC